MLSYTDVLCCFFSAVGAVRGAPRRRRPAAAARRAAGRFLGRPADAVPRRRPPGRARRQPRPRRQSSASGFACRDLVLPLKIWFFFKILLFLFNWVRVSWFFFWDCCGIDSIFEVIFI